MSKLLARIGAALRMPFLAAITMTCLATPAAAAGWTPPDDLPGDVVIGSRDAQVTVFEYASLTCPHCARFHSQMLPEFRKAYIDTGKARIVYRHFPLDKSALAGALAITCLKPENRAEAVARLFETSADWVNAADIGSAVARNTPGVDDTVALVTCMSSKEITGQVIEPALQAAKGGVVGTPTFFVNGLKLEGTAEATRLGELVDEAIKAKAGK
jgi:Protein-disulfide isomerase